MYFGSNWDILIMVWLYFKSRNPNMYLHYSQFTLALNSSPTDLSSKIPGSRDPGLPGKPPLTPHHPHGHPVPHAAAALPPPIGAVPHPADLLRGAAAAPPLFAPGLPRPGPPTADPLNPFGLPRPPYPSLFGPSPLGGYSTSYDSHVFI